MLVRCTEGSNATVQFYTKLTNQNNAYFWKILFADREAFDLYASHSLRKGANAVLAEGGDVSAAFAELVEGELCRR